MGYDELKHQSRLEMFKSVIEFSKMTIQTALLLNGGAAIAVLAFIGQIAEKQPERIATLAGSVLPFGLGAFLAGLTAGSTYLTQWLGAGDWQKTAMTFNVIGILLGLASLLCFGWGILQVRSAILVAFPVV